MGRPREFDREQAIDVAMSEFWRCGYENSSISTLAGKLGITRSSFYNAFGDRETLLKEALEHYVTEAPNCLLINVGPGDPVMPAISRMFETVCEVRAADPEARGCLLVNCIAELADTNDELEGVLSEYVSAGTERFYELLKQAAQQGEIPDTGDLHEKALALQNSLVGINLMSKVTRRKEDLLAMARQTLAGLFPGALEHGTQVRPD
jgi:TetR/AcrR family transcriptional regulator, transcriptional repressor for nem operon